MPRPSETQDRPWRRHHLQGERVLPDRLPQRVLQVCCQEGQWRRGRQLFGIILILFFLNEFGILRQWGRRFVALAFALSLLWESGLT